MIKPSILINICINFNGIVYADSNIWVKASNYNNTDTIHYYIIVLKDSLFVFSNYLIMVLNYNLKYFM